MIIRMFIDTIGVLGTDANATFKIHETTMSIALQDVNERQFPIILCLLDHVVPSTEEIKINPFSMCSGNHMALFTVVLIGLVPP